MKIQYSESNRTFSLTDKSGEGLIRNYSFVAIPKLGIPAYHGESFKEKFKSHMKMVWGRFHS